MDTVQLASLGRTRLRLTICVVCICFACAASAEPYLATQKGMQCSACHSHPAGGGKRTVYGNAFAQSELAEDRIDIGSLWTGAVNKWLSVGGDLRVGIEQVDNSGSSDISSFGVNRGNVYVEASVIPGRLSVYVDQKFAPDASQNREAYIRANSHSARWFAAAGQFYLPYGLRIQDDTSFIRRATGVNFTNPDRGIQVGYNAGSWSTIGSVTNGSGGGREIDTGKQLSFLTNYVRPKWRAGLSASINNADAGDREMFGLFAGLRTGPISWLGEVDRITDDIAAGVEIDSIAGLLEANWMFRKGHNLKFSYDYFDPDDDLSEDHRVRYSVVWEYSPVQFLQGRLGIRIDDGPPSSDPLNRDSTFLELHGFF